MPNKCRDRYRHSTNFYRKNKIKCKKPKIICEKIIDVQQSENYQQSVCEGKNKIDPGIKKNSSDNNESLSVDNVSFQYSDETNSSTDDSQFLENCPINKNNDVCASDLLRSWALENNVAHTAINQLLDIMKKLDIKNLPKDARTLLSTPKANIIIEMGNGQYWYHGVAVHLKKMQINNLEEIKIKVNIDGISPFKSSDKEFWPILFSVDEKLYRQPFVAAIYYGQGKPPLKDFLDQFVNEMSHLMEHGIIINGREMAVKISCFICDTPARSYIKGKL